MILQKNEKDEATTGSSPPAGGDKRCRQLGRHAVAIIAGARRVACELAHIFQVV
jgi:hypothetical protein